MQLCGSAASALRGLRAAGARAPAAGEQALDNTGCVVGTQEGPCQLTVQWQVRVRAVRAEVHVRDVARRGVWRVLACHGDDQECSALRAATAEHHERL
eukprot:3844415-Alexandrium_andersonii.AAC.1